MATPAPEEGPTAKRGGDATSALDSPLALKPNPRKGHHRAKHKALPPEDQAQDRAVYVAGQFKHMAERLAAQAKRADPDSGYERDNAGRREGTRFTMNQLDERQVAAIEADYRAGVMSVADMETTHRISRSTLYALAEKRAWPLRSEIQAQMAAAVQAHVVQATTADLRAEMHGPSGIDRPLLLTGAAGELLPRDSEDQPVSSRTLEDIGKQNLIAEEYGLAVGMVLGKHRAMAAKAIEACDTLLTIHTQAIEDAKQRASDMARDPVSLAKLLEPMAKSLALMLANMAKAVDLQRQALALDVGAGKGISLGDLARTRAAHAGMPIASTGDDPSPPGNAGPPAGAIPLPAGLGSYEELVREAERRGTRLA